MQRTGQTIICEVCGREVYKKARSLNASHKVCSLSCLGIARKKRIQKICRNCGKSFEVIACLDDRYKNCPDCSYSRPHTIKKVCRECGIEYTARINRQIYCSATCRINAHGRKVEGRKNYFWMGGGFNGEGYAKNWARIRAKVRKNQNFTCQICGGKGSPVHHIDRNTKNNDLANLMLLCESCHRNIHMQSLQTFHEGIVHA